MYLMKDGEFVMISDDDLIYECYGLDGKQIEKESIL